MNSINSTQLLGKTTCNHHYRFPILVIIFYYYYKDNFKIDVFTLVNTHALRALMICPFLMVVNQFSGSFAIATYAESIFKSIGSTVDPQVSSIVMATMQVIGTYAASQLMDRVGRKVLLLVSLSGCFLMLIIAATYSYLAKNDYDVMTLNWIPIVSISSFIALSSIGVLPVPYVMMSEVIPQRVSHLIQSNI